MIAAPSSGIFLNVAHFLSHAWSQDDYLQSIAPAHEGKDTDKPNRFFCYGVNHITDADLLSLGPGYVVVDDLSSSSLGLGIPGETWPHRVTVYADSVMGSQRARDRLIKLLENRSVVTEAAEICRFTFNNRRSFESTNGYASRVTITAYTK